MLAADRVKEVITEDLILQVNEAVNNYKLFKSIQNNNWLMTFISDFYCAQ